MTYATSIYEICSTREDVQWVQLPLIKSRANLLEKYMHLSNLWSPQNNKKNVETHTKTSQRVKADELPVRTRKPNLPTSMTMPSIKEKRSSSLLQSNLFMTFSLITSRLWRTLLVTGSLQNGGLLFSSHPCHHPRLWSSNAHRFCWSSLPWLRCMWSSNSLQRDMYLEIFTFTC